MFFLIKIHIILIIMVKTYKSPIEAFHELICYTSAHSDPSHSYIRMQLMPLQFNMQMKTPRTLP